MTCLACSMLQTYICCVLTLQAEKIIEENKFLKEHHIHALATMHSRDILLFQDRKGKDSLGSKVDMVHFQPGFKQQTRIMRQEAKQLMKKTPAPIPIHLNAAVSHFSGLVAVEADVTGRSVRVATKVASDVVLLE
jgi:hypothetical protein